MLRPDVINAIVFLAVAIPLFVACVVVGNYRSRKRRHSCHRCGYPKDGLPDHRCPECGADWSMAQHSCASSTAFSKFAKNSSQKSAVRESM